MIRRLIAYVSSFLLGDLAAKGGIQYNLFNNLLVAKFIPHPYLLYELKPLFVSKNKLTTHTKDGFRGPFFLTANNIKSTIVCLGDSTTYCEKIDDDYKTYPSQLHKTLKEKYRKDVQVINAGVPGYTSTETLLQYILKISNKKPKIIIYYHSHNDVHARRFPNLSRDYKEYSRSWFEPHGRSIFLGRMKRRINLAKGNITGFIRKLDETRGKRQASNVLKNPPTGFIENLKIITIIAKAYDTRVLFINPPYRTLGHKKTIKAQTVNPAWEAVNEHCKAVEKIADLHPCVVLSMAKKLPYPEEPYDFPAKYFFDPVHLNEAGAERFAKIVAEKIIDEKLL